MPSKPLDSYERVPFRGTLYVEASALDSAIEQIAHLTAAHEKHAGETHAFSAKMSDVQGMMTEQTVANDAYKERVGALELDLIAAGFTLQSAQRTIEELQQDNAVLRHIAEPAPNPAGAVLPPIVEFTQAAPPPSQTLQQADASGLTP